MDFGLFTTWNAVYQGDKVPWDPEYQGGKLLEAEAYKQNFKEIDHIEDAGWDYVWFGGGHFSTQGSMDPQSLMLSAVIANHTKNLKIGTSIHRPTLRLPGETPSPRALPHERYAFDNLQPEDPFQVAEQVAIVDQISEGRFIYGAGARTRGSDERREYFFEYLELLKQLWNEDSFTGFEGKYFNYPGFYENYMGIPKPVQKPLPMLLPVDSQESFVPMGEHGYRIAIGAGSSPHNLRGSAVLREDVQAYRNAWMKAGHEGEPSTVVRVPTLVADTQEKADRRVGNLMDLARIYLRGPCRHRQHRRRQRRPRSHRGSQPLRHSGRGGREDPHVQGGLHHRRDYVRVQLDIIRPPRGSHGHLEVPQRGRHPPLQVGGSWGSGRIRTGRRLAARFCLP